MTYWRNCDERLSPQGQKVLAAQQAWLASVSSPAIGRNQTCRAERRSALGRAPLAPT